MGLWEMRIEIRGERAWEWGEVEVRDDSDSDHCMLIDASTFID